MSPVSNEHGRMMGAVAAERVDHDRGVGAEAGLDQVVVDGADGQKRGDGRAVGVGAGGLLAIGQHNALCKGGADKVGGSAQCTVHIL